MRLTSNLSNIVSGLAEKLHQLEQGGVIYDNVMRSVALTTLSDVKRRVFNDGQAADLTDIGQYSTTPIYVNPDNSPKAFGRPIGKTGESRFTTGKRKGQDHKTRYFADGYKGFRNAIGRRTDKVNLSLSGQMNAQFTVLADGTGYFLGWPDELHKEIADGLQAHFGKVIFKLSQPEELKFAQLFEKEAANAL